MAHAQVDDLTEFLDQWERALSEPDRIYKYHALRASCAQVRGRFGEALNHWANSLTAAGETTIDSLALHSRLGDAHRLASRYDEAADHYTRAMALASDRRLRQTPAAAARCERELGRATLGLAKLKRLRCAYPAALALYRRAAEVFGAFRDEYGLIEADFGLGEVQRLQSNWLLSFRSYRRSLERALGQGNRERYAYALWGIGEIHRLTGRYGWALATHAEGAEACLKVGDMRSYGWAELGMAETHRTRGALDDALVHATRALKEFADAGSTTEVAHSKLSLAETRRLMAGRDHLGDVALDSYDEVLELYQRRGMDHCVVQAQLAKAAALITLGRHTEGMHVLDQAEQRAVEHGLPEARSQARALCRASATPFVQLNFP